MISKYEQYQILTLNEMLKPHCMDALVQVIESDNCKIHTLVLSNTDDDTFAITNYLFNRLCNSIEKNKSLRKVMCKI